MYSTTARQVEGGWGNIYAQAIITKATLYILQNSSKDACKTDVTGKFVNINKHIKNREYFLVKLQSRDHSEGPL
jgi:hypothetical protein